MWMPDVYEGAPTPVTGFMTTGLKAAAFATFVRVFISMGYGHGLSTVIQTHIHDILYVCAVLTMVFGNIIALTQTNLKRMLAYSSIAHSGYLLVGIIAGAQSEQGYAPVVLYLASYAIMNLGAFVVLTVLAKKNDSGLNLHDIAGLSSKHPWIAFSLAVFMFSMAGIPPTAGFAAKYLLFYSAIQAHETPLVVISVLCSAVSVYYYLRVLVYMYMREPAEAAAPRSRISIWSGVALAAMVVLTLQIGVLPARMMAAAKRAVTSL
jgi:NADH-quinone oxidoreductase subunit N